MLRARRPRGAPTSRRLLLGFGGLLSFSHAADFGSASYVAAHTAKVWGLTPELAIIAGALAAAVLALAIGSLAIRVLSKQLKRSP